MRKKRTQVITYFQFHESKSSFYQCIFNYFSFFYQQKFIRFFFQSRILVEFKYLPDDSKVSLTDLPILNPYNAFTKPVTSVKKIVTQLFSTKRPTSVKEYVQVSKFDQCFIPATETEQLLARTNALKTNKFVIFALQLELDFIVIKYSIS